jgi:hypothetical protein
MSFFRKSYFIRSTTHKLDGTTNKNWALLTLGFWDMDINTRINLYRHDLENKHGGVCMIDDLRRL